MAELNAAAKRLKVQKNVQSLMQGVTPQQIDSTLEQLKEVEEDFSAPKSKPAYQPENKRLNLGNPEMTAARAQYQNYQKQQRLKAPAPAPAPLPTPVPAVPEPEQPKAPENKSEEVPEKVAPVQDKCTCRPRNDCPENKRDFSFGKSCDLGQVRCCLTIENPDQPEDKEEVPTMVTKAPIPMKTQFKVATQPAKQKFFVYRVPTVAPKRMVNPEQLAKQVLSRPKPAYQPGQYYQPGQTKAPEFKSEEVGNRRANLGNQDMTAARAQYEENQRVAYENYQKHQRLMVQQEAWRRKNQPTFMEKVTDILDVRTWFG